jgi:hypothetical protein
MFKRNDRIELSVAERGQKEVTLSPADFEQALAEVCRMDPTDYLRQRRAKAEELGIPCALLDEERKRQQKHTESEAAVMQAHWNVEPWHEPVKAGELYRRIKKRIIRHVVIGDHAATALALWIMFLGTRCRRSFTYLACEQPGGGMREEHPARSRQISDSERNQLRPH